MTPFITNLPHIKWNDLVQWLTEEMNNSGEFITDFYYVDLYLNTYICDSDEWSDDAACLIVRAPSPFYNNTGNVISPFIKKFFQTYIQSPLSFFYVDT